MDASGWSAIRHAEGQKRGRRGRAAVEMTIEERLAKRAASNPYVAACVESASSQDQLDDVRECDGSLHTAGAPSGPSMKEELSADRGFNVVGVPSESPARAELGIVVPSESPAQEAMDIALRRVRRREGRECDQNLLHIVLQVSVEARLSLLTAEVGRNRGGVLPYRRTVEHVTNFLETVNWEWQHHCRVCDHGYNTLMLGLFPLSMRVVGSVLVPSMYVNNAYFQNELESVKLLVNGVPQVQRSIPEDETLHGRVLCYPPIRAKTYTLGVIDYAPSRAFPEVLKTVTFSTPSTAARIPPGSRVRFNIRDVLRDVQDDEGCWCKRPVRQAFNVSLVPPQRY